MSIPDVGWPVAYVLDSGPNAGQQRPATILSIRPVVDRGNDQRAADLTVFGLATDGVPWNAGPVNVLGKLRSQAVLTPGTWQDVPRYE